MAPVIRVVRNSITVDGRAYEARVLGGGRFNVFNEARKLVGSFAVKNRAVEAEDLGVPDTDPIELIGQAWVRENLSAAAPPAPKPPDPPPEPPAPPPSEPIALPPTEPARAPAAAPEGVSICRLVTHERPDKASFQKAAGYIAWLRTQPGVEAAYLAHDPESGKTISFSIWESREKLVELRYAKPPEGAAPLRAVQVDLLLVAKPPK